MKKSSPVRQTRCTVVMKKNAQVLVSGDPTAACQHSVRDREPRLAASRC